MAASKPTYWLSKPYNILQPLHYYLGTLGYDLGFFPLDLGPCHPKSVYAMLLSAFAEQRRFGIRNYQPFLPPTCEAL